MKQYKRSFREKISKYWPYYKKLKTYVNMEYYWVDKDEIKRNCGLESDAVIYEEKEWEKYAGGEGKEEELNM